MHTRHSRLRKYCSKTGILVRSPGEKEIADFLSDQGIDFEYEKRIVVDGYPLRPDFYLKDFNTFIEYFGMKDLHYRRSAWHKRQLMEGAKLRLIPLYRVSKGKLGSVIKVGFENLLKIKFPQRKFFDWHTHTQPNTSRSIT